jgi:hypothetical protein
MLLIKIILFALLIGLFFYSKLLPHQSSLNTQTMKYFSFLDQIFRPISRITSRLIPSQMTIGNNGLKLDLTQLILFTLFLIIFKIL